MERVFEGQPHRAVELVTIVDDGAHVMLGVKRRRGRVDRRERICSSHRENKGARDDLLIRCQTMLNCLEVSEGTTELLAFTDVPYSQIQRRPHQPRGFGCKCYSPEGEYPRGCFVVERDSICWLMDQFTERIGHDTVDFANIFVRHVGQGYSPGSQQADVSSLSEVAGGPSDAFAKRERAVQLPPQCRCDKRRGRGFNTTGHASCALGNKRRIQVPESFLVGNGEEAAFFEFVLQFSTVLDALAMIDR